MPETVFVESGCGSRLLVLAIRQQFQLRRRQVANRFQQPAVVEPIDPSEGCLLDLVKLAPRTTAVDHLGLVQPDDGLGECLVGGVADAAHRWLDACLRQSLRVTNREILPCPGHYGAPHPRRQSETTTPARVHPAPGAFAWSG